MFYKVTTFETLAAFHILATAKNYTYDKEPPADSRIRRILKKGIWKIHFMTEMITFTNSLGSIGGLGQCEGASVKFAMEKVPGSYKIKL